MPTFRRHVLTAAHCMDGAAFIPKIPEMLVVVLGLHDLRYENATSDQEPNFS